MPLRPPQTEFPVEAAAEVVRIIRAGAVRTEAGRLSQAGNDVLSYAGVVAFGNPDAPTPQPVPMLRGPGPEPSAAADAFPPDQAEIDAALAHLDAASTGRVSGVLDSVALRAIVRTILYFLLQAL